MKEGEDAISPLRGPARPDSQRIRSGDDEEAGGEGDHQVVRGQGQQEPPQRKPSLDSSAPTAPTPHRDQTIINGRWRIERVLGKGSFGTIQLAVHIHTGEEVAVKMERKSHSSQLTHERRVYRILDGAPGFPRVHAVGENDTHRYIVMDRMGPSLEDLLTMCGNKLSVTTVMQIAEQMISRVQELHENGIIHRDIKPDNFCLGLGKGKTGNLYAIDFGLSKQFLDLRTNRHIAERRTPIKDIIGTARYCSLRSHEGQQLARRDDIEYDPTPYNLTLNHEP
ncbi:kinase-like domain-containing protein [Baffinella frigidus]|nr:kinase-like domain-containing protein [Cryptophyta sp. CCMP2293]